MEQEHHITADVAYALVQYCETTNDIDFLLDYGLEILLETARFWASRTKHNRRKKRHEIHNVIGPDEFHENVNNNACTNLLAQWNLSAAVRLYRECRRKYPDKTKGLASRINLKPAEIDLWRRIASTLYLPVSRNTGIIDQFEGYFARKKLPLPELDHHSLPLYPKGVRDLGKTQYVKQADVIMMLFLLPDAFNLETKRKNFLFYEKRTLHKSSLSASIHAALAAEVGEEHKAGHYFNVAVYADLNNIYGNTDAGIHAASLGGAWQALIHGFAGVRIRKGILSFNPKLPSQWEKLKTFLMFKGFALSVEIERKKVNLFFKSRRKTDQLPVRVQNVSCTLQANKKHHIPLEPAREISCKVKDFY